VKERWRKIYIRIECLLILSSRSLNTVGWRSGLARKTERVTLVQIECATALHKAKLLAAAVDDGRIAV